MSDDFVITITARLEREANEIKQTVADLV